MQSVTFSDNRAQIETCVVWRRTVVVLTLFVSVVGASAAERITYSRHVRPIFASNCLSCHNADRQRAGLDLSSFSGVIAGGSGGQVVVPEAPDDSALFAVVAHQRQPHMPPNKPRLDDATLKTLRTWIAQGVYNTTDSRAPAPKKAAGLELALGDVPARPDDVTKLMPRGLPLREIVHAERAGAITALAGQTWAPLVAIAGQQQVLLYEPRRGELLGVLPFAPGFPRDLDFSRSGQLLTAGGGVGGQNGAVTLYSVRDGRSLGQLGEAYDAVLASHLDATQQRLALGGPGRVVKVYDPGNREQIHRIEKHTEWITALAYSPDAVLLATADRNGGLEVWEALSQASFHTLDGHKAAITDLAWRIDSNVLASVGEDGRLRLWEMHHGREVKSWRAHDGGALALDFSPEGLLVSGGRDRVVKLWSQDGKALRALGKFDDLVTSVVFCDGGKLVVAGDLTGEVRVWNAADGKQITTLDANPKPFDHYLSAAVAAVKAATEQKERYQRTLAARQSELAAAQQVLAKLKNQLGGAEAALERAQDQVTEKNNQRQRAAAALQAKNAALEKSNRELAKVSEDAARATEAVAAAARADAAAQRALSRLETAATVDNEPESAESVDELAALRKEATESAARLATAQAEMERAKAALGAVRPKKDALQAERDEKQASLKSAEAELANAEGALAEAKDTLAQRRQKVVNATAAAEEKQTAATEAESKYADAVQRLSSAKRHHAKWQAGALRSERDRVRAGLADLRRDTEETVAEAERAQNALAAAQRRLAAARDELSNKDAVLAQREEDIATGEKKLATAKETAQRRATQLVACRAFVNEYASRATAARELVDQHEDLPSEFLTAVNDVGAIHRRLEAALQHLEQAREDAAFAVEDAQFELEAAHYAAEQSREKFATLPDKITQLSQETQAADQASHVATEQAAAAADSLQAREAQLAELEAQYANLIATWLD